MGEWIDVYTDDILPCSDDWNRYVGVHSDDKNVVWAPLAEKALARFFYALRLKCRDDKMTDKHSNRQMGPI